MNQENSNSSIASAIILGAILLGGLFIGAAIDLIECPKCHGNFLLMWACPLCGHDGKITILQYLMYQFSGR